MIPGPLEVYPYQIVPMGYSRYDRTILRNINKNMQQMGQMGDGLPSVSIIPISSSPLFERPSCIPFDPRFRSYRRLDLTGGLADRFLNLRRDDLGNGVNHRLRRHLGLFRLLCGDQNRIYDVDYAVAADYVG